MNLKLKGEQMITKKSSYLILLSLLLFPIVIIAAGCPIIFVHGRQGSALPQTGWQTWCNTAPTAMTEIVKEEYGGYKYGRMFYDGPFSTIAIYCHRDRDLEGMPDSRRIYNFSYQNPDGGKGVIGSDDSLECSYIMAWFTLPGTSPQIPQITNVPKDWVTPEDWVYGYDYGYTNPLAGDSWAENLAIFIDSVLAATGASQVDIVAHSLGGPIARAAMRFYGCNTKVRKLLTVGSPNNPFNHSPGEAYVVNNGDPDWIHVGEDWEVACEGREFGGNITFKHVITSEEKPFLDFLDDPHSRPTGAISTIAGTRCADWSCLSWTKNDGVVIADQVPESYARFNAQIYASHSTGWTDNPELALNSCSYVTDFIKKWIIDDDETHTTAQISGTAQVIYDDPSWPNIDDKYCGSIRIKIPVTDYRDVLNVITEVYGNTWSFYHSLMPGNPLMAQGALIQTKIIPLYKCPQSGTGRYVSLMLEPGIFGQGGDFYIYTIYLRINDMENGEVDKKKLTVWLSPHGQFPEYNGETVTGSFVDVLEPVSGSYIPGTMQVRWVSNENVHSRHIYFSTNGGGTYTEIASLGSRGKGTDWWCEDSYICTVPVVASNQCKIKVVENIDNVTFISDESETFSVPGDIVFQSATILLGWTRNYQAYNTITATNNFIIEGNGSEGADVTMAAGDTVYLKTGFQAQEGCEFHAYTDQSIRWNPSTSASVESKPLALIPKAKKDSSKTSVELSSEEPRESIPTVFSCAQNKPNPFVRSTTINYGLPKDSDVVLTVFNLAGQAVRTLVNTQQNAGFKSVRWDGCNNAGVQMPQGIYFYVFRAGDFEKHHKMILLK